MSKLVKSRLIKACFCIVIGLIIFIFSMLDNNLDYEIRNYLNGISFGVGFVGLFFLAHSIILIRNPKKSKELENCQNDERLITIYDKSMSISFRLAIVLEAIISIIFAFAKNMIVAEVMGFIISLQLILYIVVYCIVSKNN